MYHQVRKNFLNLLFNTQIKGFVVMFSSTFTLFLYRCCVIITNFIKENIRNWMNVMNIWHFDLSNSIFWGEKLIFTKQLHNNDSLNEKFLSTLMNLQSKDFSKFVYVCMLFFLSFNCCFKLHETDIWFLINVIFGLFFFFFFLINMFDTYIHLNFYIFVVSL